MDAKTYLEQLQEFDVKINQDLQLLEEMRANAFCTGGTNFSERVQTSQSSGNVEKAVSAYMDFNNDINAEIDRFYDAKRRIINEIRDLHDVNYIQVLFKVYVQYKNLVQASKEMKLSYTHTLDIHKKALKAFSDTHKTLRYLA